MKWAPLIYFISIIFFLCIIMSFSSNDYFESGNTPNGWYKQLSYIGAYSIQDNGATLFFPVCDHYYLGPLHGKYTVSESVILEEGRYIFRVENNIIVEAIRYEVPK